MQHHFTRQFGERVDRHGQVIPLPGKFTGSLIDEIASKTPFRGHQTMTVLWKGRVVHKFDLRGKTVPQVGDPIPSWVHECIREKREFWPHCRLVWWRGQRRSDTGVTMEW